MAARPTIAAVVKKMLALRAEKAKLLGYDSYAALKLDDTMAKTPKAVFDLLDPVWEKAREKAAADEAELQRLAAAAGSNEKIAGWDWRFYQEQLRAEKYAFDEAELKPYLQLEKIIEACFDVATRLFGVTFVEKHGIPAWHPDVRVFEVLNADGTRRGLFLADYFARPSKRSGAWMSALQSGYRLGKARAPIIYNVMNFAKPPAGEAGAAFARRGEDAVPRIRPCAAWHADRRHWPSHVRHVGLARLRRTAVAALRALADGAGGLEKYALHYKTGEPMPKALLDKMLAATTFDAGFATVEFTSSALVDMAYHARRTRRPIRCASRPRR